MGNCDGRWESTVHGDDDGILDLGALKHEHDHVKDTIRVLSCGGVTSLSKRRATCMPDS